ncbi:MAG: hypothetical protein AABW92_05210 [Nanoarchaeota archaeon]
MTLDGDVEGIFKQYRLFRKELSSMIAKEVQSGNYSQLHSPNTKGSNKVEFPQYIARVNILPRNPLLDKEGVRNLNAGKLEVVVVLQAPLINPLDYTKGIQVKGIKDSFRITAGENLVYYEEILDGIVKSIRMNYDTICFCLEEGKYKPVVKQILHAVDSSLYDCKKEKGVFKQSS